MPFFFFDGPAPTDISPLSLHDALPISGRSCSSRVTRAGPTSSRSRPMPWATSRRSEEHTSELHSRLHFLCPFFFLMDRRPPISPLFPYTTLFRSRADLAAAG